MSIEDKLTEKITGLDEEDNDKLARWGQSFGKKHGVMPDEKGFHETCVSHMEGNIDDPAAYCAAVKDAYHGSTYWRGKDKSEKEVKASVKKHPNVTKGKKEPIGARKQDGPSSIEN